MLVRNPIPCDEIREDALRTLPFGAATMPEVGEWVITTYQVDETSVMEQQNQLSWNLPNRSFTARFEDDILRRVIVYWSMGPTVEEIIDCLGTPEYYEATIKRDIRPRFDFVLWYPSQGLVAGSSHFRRGSMTAEDVSKDYRMDRFIVTKPGALENVVAIVYGGSSIDEVPDELISTIKPWPGSLDQIVVDNLLLK